MPFPFMLTTTTLNCSS